MNITHEWLANNHSGEELRVFAKECNYDFGTIWNTCQRGDWLMWLLRKLDKLDKPLAVRIALACVDHVWSRATPSHPDYSRSRMAMEMAETWLKSQTEENQQKACKLYNGFAGNAFSCLLLLEAVAADAVSKNQYEPASWSAYVCVSAAADAFGPAELKSEQKWQADKIREITPAPRIT